MIIAPNHGFVFICMPKCASTSTEAILRPFGQILTGNAPEFKHMPYRYYERFFRPLLRAKLKGKLRQIETVCLFREPVDWVNSWYRYRQRDELMRSPQKRKNSTRGVSFEEFAREYVSGSPRPFAQIGRQIKMIQDKDGNVGQIRLFRYEDYDKFLAYMSEKVGQPLVAPRMNVSPAGESETTPDLPFLTGYLAPEYEIYRSLGS